MILAIIILLYIIGIIVTYIITRTRAELVKKKSKGTLFNDDQDIGVVTFSILSFIGLIIFLIVRLIDIVFKTIDKLLFNDNK